MGILSTLSGIAKGAWDVVETAADFVTAPVRWGLDTLDDFTTSSSGKRFGLFDDDILKKMGRKRTQTGEYTVVQPTIAGSSGGSEDVLQQVQQDWDSFQGFTSSTLGLDNVGETEKLAPIAGQDALKNLGVNTFEILNQMREAEDLQSQRLFNIKPSLGPTIKLDTSFGGFMSADENLNAADKIIRDIEKTKLKLD